jgi:hypothetical protein
MKKWNLILITLLSSTALFSMQPKNRQNLKEAQRAEQVAELVGVAYENMKNYDFLHAAKNFDAALKIQLGPYGLRSEAEFMLIFMDYYRLISPDESQALQPSKGPNSKGPRPYSVYLQRFKTHVEKGYLESEIYERMKKLENIVGSNYFPFMQMEDRAKNPLEFDCLCIKRNILGLDELISQNISSPDHPEYKKIMATLEESPLSKIAKNAKALQRDLEDQGYELEESLNLASIRDSLKIQKDKSTLVAMRILSNKHGNYLEDVKEWSNAHNKAFLVAFELNHKGNKIFLTYVIINKEGEPIFYVNFARS